jgi:hypothetical protein
MDGALHVIARLFGMGYAQQVALGEEYDWKAGQGYARAALADNRIPHVPLDSLGTWEVVRTEGDTRRWTIQVRGRSDLVRVDLVSRLEQALAVGKWTKLRTAGANRSSNTSRWRFSDDDRHAWSGTLNFESVGVSGHEFTLTLSIARAG